MEHLVSLTRASSFVCDKGFGLGWPTGVSNNESLNFAADGMYLQKALRTEPGQHTADWDWLDRKLIEFRCIDSTGDSEP